MKKICLTIIFIILFGAISYGEVDELVDQFLVDITEGQFTKEDLTTYQINNYDSDGHNALELFLTARLELFDYKYAEAYDHLEHSLKLLDGDVHLKLKAEVLYYLSEIDMYFFNLTSSVERSFELRALSTSIDYKKGIIEADHNIAFAYIYYYDYDQGTKFATDAFDLSREEGYNPGLSEYFAFLGNLDYYYGDYDKAIEKWIMASDQLDEVVHDYVVEEPHIDYQRAIGSEQIRHGDAEAGLKLINELIATVDIKNTYLLYMLNESLGNYYSETDLNLTLDHLNLALEMYQQSSIIERSYPYEVYIYESLGNTHFDLGNFQEAAVYFYDVLNFDYPDKDDDIEATIAGLDEIKYTELNNKMSLLEQLNDANEESVSLSKNLIRVMTISIIILMIAVVIIVLEIRSKSKTEKELYVNSITDSLTNVYNRGKIIDIFQKNLYENNAVLLLDLDDFKDVNDTYGHVMGDEVLVTITEIIKGSIRETDKLGRYGGEEFLVFLENTNTSELNEIAERVRFNIESHEWCHEDLKTTASIGITTCFSSNAEEVLHEVDTLMYQAKNAGKNRVVYG